MKRIILLSLLLLLSMQFLKAQSVFIKSGRNLNNYIFSSSGNEVANLQNEIGQSYEFGYISKIPQKKRFYYGFSLGLEEYNASGSYASNNLVWETSYANFKGLGYYKLLQIDRNSLAVKGGLGFATLIHGRQQINGGRYDLLKETEFKGLFLNTQLGLSYSFSINNDIHLLADYDYGKQYSLANSSNQKLSFNNHSLSLGFSININ
ncbi:hypothetical protein FYC62_12150 [Pedobacter aquae]|uniref:Outer membrane protein beta-barrel domain-containing protein n=1 Tax=Pedobacter aquae TaxID=2605747 RepID=A0A5C0VI17_9SPHI|nr:hypothetical protein [Pedobacter aquae]QEK52315.1 hypothetical protein FYC62_12150 [Pedobacter aquae]